MKFRFSLIAALLCLLPCAFMSAQSKTASGKTAPAAANASTTAEAGSPVAEDSVAETPSVPDTFRSIALGTGLDAVKELLVADSVFGYRGERDVSLLTGENRSLIETNGLSYIKRAWFQFHEDKLYIMTFSLDPEKVDYYSIYSHLVEKYGEPTSLDPRKAVWGDERVTLSLERPLTVKYTDAETFKTLLESDMTGKAASDIAREDFINEF